MTTTTIRARAATTWRSTSGDAVLVARRRSRQDAGLLALAAVVLAVTVRIALAVPRVVLRTADAGVQGAVRDAGTAADVVTVFGRGPGLGGVKANGQPARVDNAATLAANAATVMQQSLPASVQAVTGPVVTAVQSGQLGARLADDLVTTRFVHLGTPTTTEPVVRWVSGSNRACRRSTRWARRIRASSRSGCRPLPRTGSASPSDSDCRSPGRPEVTSWPS